MFAEGVDRMKKYINFRFCIFSLTLIAVFSFIGIMSVNAVSIGIVTKGVYARSAPNTSVFTEVYGEIPVGVAITVVATVPTNDSSSGCSTGLWYKHTYNGKTAYSCSANIDITNKYNRPWTTPKKSIIGGAIFKAENYISKGQFNSYLIKFNVNPNSTNTMYSHQYMTNIRAPYYEAKTSYGMYSENNLLNKTIVFTIPVFNNMPNYTYLSGWPNYAGQSTVTDVAFETLLDKQGFNESYKRQLRALHTDYPSWIFEALPVGRDWYAAVNAEMPSSRVDSYSLRLNDTVVEGSNWYMASNSAVAYFMDPRNFLIPERVLMFEKLAYSTVYTEAVIQSRLDSTFMAGNSVPDGQSYSSIFVQAGQQANISPVYLVSQAVQEIGSNGSIATTGELFEYNGVCYKGLYNFFNIGAVGGASSPAKAGLVWANGGSSLTIVSCNGTSTGAEIGYLNALGLTKTAGYITGTDLNQTAASIVGVYGNVTVSVTATNGAPLTGTARLTTGSIIKIKDATNTYTSTVVIYGDISGDGDINAIDLLYMRKYLLKNYNLTGANLQAAKIAKKSDVGAADLLYLRKYLLDKNAYKITQ